MRHLLRCLVLCSVLASPALAQERQFSVTMPESQWNSLARILGKVPWAAEETMPIINSIGQQVGASIAQEQQQRAASAKELADLKAEVDRLKAELDKLKNPPPEAPQ